jgi:hypothetical protein
MSDENGLTKAAGAVPALDDLYGFADALAYVNERLPADRRLSPPGFRRHVFDDPARPGSLFQLEPLALGRTRGGHGDRAVARVFTRRMLDEYLANREANARRGVERRVTRPTDAERAAVLSWRPARARMNARLAANGVRWRVGEAAFLGWQARGVLPHRIVGRAAVYLAADVDEFTRTYLRRWRGSVRRPHAGRPMGRA